MAKRRPPLNVWLYEMLVATITSQGPGQITLEYTVEALDTWPGNTPLLSCSLPLSSRAHRDAGLYFRGMLPEGRHLQALATMARVPTYDTFGILARFGRDVAGACVVGVEPPRDHPGTIEPYDHASLDDEVAGLEDRPLAIYDDSELSLPGLQNKLLLVATAKGWARPVGGRPSTHILKLEDPRFPGLVAHEADALRLARHLGLTSVDAHTQTIGGLPCLIVSRFDRLDRDGATMRIHQEDACQALSRDHEAARFKGKYEHAGGPGLRDVAGLLDRYAANPLDELEKLVRVVAFTVGIGNADAHGKNLALLHPGPGQVQLAPLYDTVPTVCWPSLPTRAAMSVNGRTDLPTITIADIAAEADRWRFAAASAAEAARATLSDLIHALDIVPVSPILEAQIRRACANMLADPGPE